MSRRLLCIEANVFANVLISYLINKPNLEVSAISLPFLSDAADEDATDATDATDDDDGGIMSAVPDVLLGIIKQFGKCMGTCAFKNMLSGMDEIERICPSQCATEILNAGKEKIKTEVKALL